MRVPLGLLLSGLLLAGCLDAEPGSEPLDRGVEPAGASPDAPPAWASPDAAEIFPGAPIRTEKRDCPSNFVFESGDGGTAYLGTSAFCVRDLPIGSLAVVGGAENFAILVYSSWQTMEEVGEQDRDAREYNDFAVFYIDSSARTRVSPALPLVGGPTGLAEGGDAGVGSRVRFRSVAASPVPEVAAPEWRDGVVTGQAGAWALLVHSAAPALPGGTAGAVLTQDGRALGVVVSLGVAPNPGANGIARLDALLGYAREHAKLDMGVATP